MKKVVSLMLIVLMMIGLAGCLGGVSQEDYDKVVAERNALQEQIDALNANEDDMLLFKTAGYVFSLYTTCVELSDDIVQVTIPYEIKNTEDMNDFSEKAKLLFQGVSTGLSKTDYASCIIMFVDDEECYMGVSLKSDGSTSTFAIEE